MNYLNAITARDVAIQFEIVSRMGDLIPAEANQGELEDLLLKAFRDGNEKWADDILPNTMGEEAALKVRELLRAKIG